MSSEQASETSKSVLGMVALEQAIFPGIENIVEILQRDWALPITPSDYNLEENNAAILQIQGQVVVLMFVEAPIPWENLEPVCRSAYYWPEASELLRTQEAHVVVSVMSDASTLIKYKLMTQVIAAILQLSPTLGIYMGAQSLVIPPTRYLEDCELLKKNSLPIALWLYFGMFAENDQEISGYTYGLSEFGKMELEINHSKQSLTDIYGFLYNISHYLLSSDPLLKDGETIGMTPEQKVAMTYQKSRYLDDTLIIDLAL